MFLGAFVRLSVFVITQKLCIFLKFLPKFEVIEFWERSRSYSGYKRSPEFSTVPFSMILGFMHESTH